MSLSNFVGNLKSVREFQPVPYYESETDSMICYFHDIQSYSKRIDEYVTLFLAISDDSLVGVEIKGVSLIMKKEESQ